MSRIQITAKATTQGRKKQKQTLTTGDLLIENGLGGDQWRFPRRLLDSAPLGRRRGDVDSEEVPCPPVLKIT
jgi:hypothetical protein